MDQILSEQRVLSTVTNMSYAQGRTNIMTMKRTALPTLLTFISHGWLEHLVINLIESISPHTFIYSHSFTADMKS